MTTPLTKPVRREARREQLIVTLGPDGVSVREKGRRCTYGPVSLGMIKLIAARQMAEATRKAKLEARALKRALRTTR